MGFASDRSLMSNILSSGFNTAVCLVLLQSLRSSRALAQQKSPGDCTDHFLELWEMQKLTLQNSLTSPSAVQVSFSIEVMLGLYLLGVSIRVDKTKAKHVQFKVSSNQIDFHRVEVLLWKWVLLIFFNNVDTGYIQASCFLFRSHLWTSEHNP